MKCVEAVDHDECVMDCPDCHDPRMIPEEAWPSSPVATLSERGRSNPARKVRT